MSFSQNFFFGCHSMKLDKWEYNNFYSVITEAMHYNLCIYHKELDLDEESVEFFRYILENDYNKVMSDSEIRREIGVNFSNPVAIIRIKPPQNDSLGRRKEEPIPLEILIRTKNIFCPDAMPDVNKRIKCSYNDNMKTAIFKSNLELKRIGFDIDLLCGMSEDYKI